MAIVEEKPGVYLLDEGKIFPLKDFRKLCDWLRDSGADFQYYPGFPSGKIVIHKIDPMSITAFKLVWL